MKENHKRKDKYLIQDDQFKKIKLDDPQQSINKISKKELHPLPSKDLVKQFIEQLQIQHIQNLIEIKEKTVCPQCKSKKKFYCSNCHLILQGHEWIPKVQLPLNVKMQIISKIQSIFYIKRIHHEKENPHKSSALPIKLLSKEFVEIINFPSSQLDQFDTETTYFLYPHKNAILIEDMPQLELNKMKNIVIIDCTWFQSPAILNSLSQKQYKFIKLKDYETLFWRYNHHSQKCLSSCEALYYFFREYDSIMSKQYDGKFDGLLFYFCLQLMMINK